MIDSLFPSPTDSIVYQGQDAEVVIGFSPTKVADLVDLRVGFRVGEVAVGLPINRGDASMINHATDDTKVRVLIPRDVTATFPLGILTAEVIPVYTVSGWANGQAVPYTLDVARIEPMKTPFIPLPVPPPDPEPEEPTP